MTKRIPVVDGLFTETPEGPRLLGSRCTTCGTPYFPKAPVCRNPDCRVTSLEDAAFGPRGKIWSYSVQDYPPPPPAKYEEPYTHYALGLVDLPGGLRVRARTSTPNPEDVRPGMEVQLVLERLYTDPEGNEVITWKFQPV